MQGEFRPESFSNWRVLTGDFESTKQVSPTNDNGNGIPFWRKQFRHFLSTLLEDVGSYTPEQQASHLQFLEECILPAFGPEPAETKARSLLTPNGTPLEASINLNESRQPCVRFTFEPFTLPGKRYEDTPVPRIAEAIGADTRWLKQFADAFFETEVEANAVLEKMPKDTLNLPRCVLAFDLDGGKRSMKAYFYPIIRDIASGINCNNACIDLLKQLEPMGQGFKPALDYIEQYKPLRDQPAIVQVMGLDCIDPAQGARVKMYMNPHNTFESVWDHVTFGGKKTDETTLEGLRVLREMWHLFINEPEPVDDSFSKALNVPKSGHKGMVMSWEVRPGHEIPDTKVYVPLFQYFSSDRAVGENLGKAFKMRGWKWGTDGSYEATLAKAW